MMYAKLREQPNKMIHRRLLLIAVCSLLTMSPAIRTAAGSDEDYALGADSMRQEGVPQGKVTKAVWRSKVFPETIREYWVYVPARRTSMAVARGIDRMKIATWNVNSVRRRLERLGKTKRTYLEEET
jgi:hypothetical protein